MARPASNAPPTAPDQGADDGVRDRADTPQTTDEIKRGVLRQRKHIQNLDGEDPLRGGVAD